jgi:hypothetical protein
MQDAEFQPEYCSWAEDKWPKYRGQIEEVRFEFGARGPYSDVTPDVDAYVQVEIKTKDGKWHYEDAGLFLGDVISEILRWAQKSGL